MLAIKKLGRSFLNNTFKISTNSSFIKFQKLRSSVYVNHRDTFDNNDDTPFDFTPENYKKIDTILVNLTILNNLNTKCIFIKETLNQRSLTFNLFLIKSLNYLLNPNLKN